MKKIKLNKFIFLPVICLLVTIAGKVMAQDEQAASKELVKLRYFNDNNRLQYLVVESLLKTGRKTEPLKNKTFQLYLDSNTPGNFIASVTTNENGVAKSILPPSLKTAWDATPQHNFIAIEKGKDAEPVAGLEIIKANIQLDTASAEGNRTIIVQVKKLENTTWMPAGGVEIKVGIKRLGGMLAAGEEETYTTDSSGVVTLQLNKINLPGDQKGNILLVAKVEDNELFGNLLIEKAAPWGTAVKPDNSFFEQRTLWSTRFRTPFWLLFMAYSIAIAVWGTLVYLILQLVKIKKLGASASS